MDLGTLSMRYAKALLLFAEEKGEAEKVYAETQTLAESFLNVPLLHQAMINPVLTAGQKASLLLEAACGENTPSAALTGFANLVVENRRADLFKFVAHSYGTLYRKKNHIVRGKLTLPASLTPELEQRLKDLVETRSNAKVDFRIEEDKAIQGGFILEYDTYRLDASVRTQLAKIKRELK